MPKAVSIAFVALSLAVAVAACNSTTSTPTPTPAPTFSTTPDPSIRDARVSVTLLGTPAPNVPVAESTPRSKTNPRPGRAFVTQITDKSGETIFRHLTPNQTYCWVATLAPGQTSSACASWTIWQTTTVTVGT